MSSRFKFGKKILTAYDDDDSSVWIDYSGYGFLHAEVDNIRQAQKLLELTDEQAKQLENGEEIGVDIDGKTYLVNFW